MKKRADEIKRYILDHVEQHPKDIATHTALHFNVTRTTAHRHIAALVKQGKLYKAGTTNQTVYSLPHTFNKFLQYDLTPDLSESNVWAQHFNHLKNDLSKNVYDICAYGFTEMLNNAIDHSLGQTVSITTERKENKFIISIYDNGIGIFKKLKEAFNFDDEKESILQLSKGKLTTDPDNHSGEGIFFSSRVFDRFGIAANGLKYVRDNTDNDWFFESQRNRGEVGTLFKMEIDLTSQRNMGDVFKKYVNPDTQAFDKTHILVNLSLSNEDRFVSRSQAKRILFGLEKFNHIILDFKDINAVGQAFVDEVFRVFKNANPNIIIDVINTNPEVQFMIDRGIATAAQGALITPATIKNSN